MIVTRSRHFHKLNPKPIIFAPVHGISAYYSVSSERQQLSTLVPCSGITDEQKICMLTVNNTDKLKHISKGNFVLIAGADETSDQYRIYSMLEKNAKVIVGQISAVQKPFTYGYKHKNWQDYPLGAPDFKNHAGQQIFRHFPKWRPFWKMAAIFVQTRVLPEQYV